MVRDALRILCGLVKIKNIIIWHSINMRAGETVLRFDWSRAGLGVDLPVFVLFPYEDWLKISFKTGKMFMPAFNMVTGLSTSSHQALQGSCFGLESVKVC